MQTFIIPPSTFAAMPAKWRKRAEPLANAYAITISDYLAKVVEFYRAPNECAEATIHRIHTEGFTRAPKRSV
jgi:hypothetical protein